MNASSTGTGQPRVVSLKTALGRGLLILIVGMLAYLCFFKPDETKGLVAPGTLVDMFDNFSKKLDTTGKNAAEIRQTVSDEMNGLTEEIKTLRQELDGVKQQESTQEATKDRLFAELIALHKRGQQLREELDALKKLTTDWNNRILLLDESENGRRLAMVASQVDIFEQLAVANRPSDLDFAMWKEQLDTLLTRVDDAYEIRNENVVVSQEDVTAVARIGLQIRQYADELQQDKALLEAMIEESPQEIPDDARTLKAARALRRRELSSNRRQSLADEMQQAYENRRDRIGAARAESERLIAEATAVSERLIREARIVSEEKEGRIRAKRIGATADEQKRQAEVQYEKQLALAASQEHRQKYRRSLPEIRRLLVPFISHGHRQTNGQKWLYSDKAAPLSLGGLRTGRALQNDAEGYEALLWVAGGPYNDRPNGAFRSTIGGRATNGEIPVIRRAQILLTEFGDLMVEDGLLLP